MITLRGVALPKTRGSKACFFPVPTGGMGRFIAGGAARLEPRHAQVSVFEFRDTKLARNPDFLGCDFIGLQVCHFH
jgi:hypothetical protein